MEYTSEHPLAVNCVLFGYDVQDSDLKVFLIERVAPPFEGKWAIPGGFVIPGESVDDTAIQVLFGETGVKDLFLEQLYTFGNPRRGPGEHVVSVAYYALISINENTLTPDTEVRNAAWFSISDIPDFLAFDHDQILAKALERLQGKIRYQPIAFELLPTKFSLTQLQRLYETILEQKLDKRNFRKKLSSMGILQDLGEIEHDVSHRAARLYSFNERAYRRMQREGFLFEIREGSRKNSR
ncbi:MAG: NUDIX hydrolase [Verrucomicrobiales bacterium]|nr:NUDIX hydrolase [Verrucomicrobiales bacterium]